MFVIVDLDGSNKDPVVNFFGVKEEDAPVVHGFDMAGNKKYKHTEKIRWGLEHAVPCFLGACVRM